MNKVKSFNLSQGVRIGNYRVLENVGRGWEGEIYKVEEVPTEAIRALKLFRTDELDSVRHVIHFAWYYEKLRETNHFPIYHHYGQWFFDDNNGCWFLVFEFIDGEPLCTPKLASETQFFALAKAVATVHSYGFAIGDFGDLTNVFVRKSDKSVVFIDCEPGEPDYPNTNFCNDCTDELAGAAKTMFEDKPPASVVKLLEQLTSNRFSENTLEEVLSDLKIC